MEQITLSSFPSVITWLLPLSRHPYASSSAQAYEGFAADISLQANMPKEECYVEVQKENCHSTIPQKPKKIALKSSKENVMKSKDNTIPIVNSTNDITKFDKKQAKKSAFLARKKMEKVQRHLDKNEWEKALAACERAREQYSKARMDRGEAIEAL
eukprot:476666-Hanusia_phi.AAC.1